MNQIQSTLLSLLPGHKKTTSSGWISINAVCCHHRGHGHDTRARGGLILTNNNGFTWHCFNCGFKAGWSPGRLLSENAKKLFTWFGLSAAEIGQLNLVALKIKEAQPIVENLKILDLSLKEVALPSDARPIDQWLTEGCQDPYLLLAIDYLLNERAVEWDWYTWYWSPSPAFKDRVIIPFYQNNVIVGYTGRKITDGKPKYLTESQSGYVFNIDRQQPDRAFVIVVEGQFDAIAIDGVALMTSEPNDLQVLRINQLQRQVICVPDRDQAGSLMLKHAVANNWSVSLPPWGNSIKDVADAVKKYGRLYVLSTILHYRVHGEIKIQLIKNKLGIN